MVLRFIRSFFQMNSEPCVLLLSLDARAYSGARDLNRSLDRFKSPKMGTKIMKLATKWCMPASDPFKYPEWVELSNQLFGVSIISFGHAASISTCKISAGAAALN